MAIDLSIVIPARNEEACIGMLLDRIYRTFAFHRVDYRSYEVIVVNDHSDDATAVIAREHQAVVINKPEGTPPGYGTAVRLGLEKASGRYITVMVADCSDDPQDLMRMWQLALDQQLLAVFGDRFAKTSRVTDYPWVKMIANRLGNHLVSELVGRGLRYADWTNPFRVIRSDVLFIALTQCQSNDFSLGMELAVRSYQRIRDSGGAFEIIPVNWSNRSRGTSKFKVKHAFKYLKTLWHLLSDKDREDIKSCLGLLVLFLLVVGSAVFFK